MRCSRGVSLHLFNHLYYDVVNRNATEIGVLFGRGTMKREELEEMFPCGTIQEELHNSSIMVWGFQLLYAAIAVWGIYRSVLLYRELGSGMNMWLILLVMVAGYALLRMYQQDDVEIYIATEGLILKRTPILVKERIERFFAPDLYLTFVHYQGIMGFGEDWKTLYVQTETGGIYIVPISLQFLSHQDKMKVLEALNRYKNT